MSDLSQLSINSLSKLTGKDRRTITKKLKDVEHMRGTKGNAKYYDPVIALPEIYKDENKFETIDLDGEVLDLNLEKARLARAQTEKTKLEAEKSDIQIKMLKKELLSVEVVELIWGKILGNFKSKLLSLPKKVAPTYRTWKSAKVAEKAIRKEVNECLEELSEFNDEDYHRELTEKGFI